MAKTKMTHTRAHDIANALTRKALAHEYEAVNKMEATFPDLARATYMDFIKPYTEAINSLPIHFQPEFCNEISFVVSTQPVGESAPVQVMNFYSETPLPQVKTGWKGHRIVVTQEKMDELLAPIKAKQDLKQRAQQLNGDLYQNALACKTVEDLAALWPEAKDIIMQAAGVVPPAASVTCPLDALLGKYLKALPAPEPKPETTETV